jgi:hypothetical protein
MIMASKLTSILRSGSDANSAASVIALLKTEKLLSEKALNCESDLSSTIEKAQRVYKKDQEDGFDEYYSLVDIIEEELFGGGWLNHNGMELSNQPWNGRGRFGKKIGDTWPQGRLGSGGWTKID